MFILEFLYDLINYQAPGMEGVNYGIAPWVIPAITTGIQLLGAKKAKKDAKRREQEAEENREAALQRLQDEHSEVPQSVIDAVQAQKELNERAYQLGLQNQERAIDVALDKLRRNDPRAATASLSEIITESGISGQNLGLTHAQQQILAEQPILSGEKEIADMWKGITMSDIVGSEAAFQAAVESGNAAQAAAYNAPQNFLTTYTAGGGKLEDLLKTKDGGYISKKAMGGTVAELLNEGDSFFTPGVEDHDKQEFDIVDSETGEVVAKSTGGERHTVEEGGAISVTNSEQEDTMFQAFSEVSNADNPTNEELKKVYAAVYKVYNQPQFQEESIA